MAVVKPLSVLFLCRGNSSRSVIAESLLNFWGGGRYRAMSAGSEPRGEVHPMTLEVLRRCHHPVQDLRSKSWLEFSGPQAPELDFVFTLCDATARASAPPWNGRAMSAHWSVDDPAATEGSEVERFRSFTRTYRELDARVKLFTNLRLEALDAMSLRLHLDAIGRRTSSPDLARA